jgi:flavin-dependent dehydrogenase
MQLAAGSWSARLPLPKGMALSRQVFDAALVEAAIDAGARFLPQTRGEWVGFEDDVRLMAYQADQNLEVRLSRNHGEIIAQTRFAVAADGLGGTFLDHVLPVPGSRIGAGLVTGDVPAYYEPGTIYMACGRHGYLGLVRLEDGRLDLAAALDAMWVREAGGPGAAADALLESVGWQAPVDLARQPWRGTSALTRTAPEVASAARVFRIGDAAGYVEPFTGEGMAWALAAAVAVAPLAERAAVEWQPSLERQWEHTYRRIVRRRQWTCRAAAAVLRRPWLTRACVAALAHWPGLAGPIVYHLNYRTARSAPLALW